MSTLLLLCLNFFKTGLLAVGGGLATLPFITDMSNAHPDWFTKADIANMVAVSESTPGPIGINMATYVGYNVAGFLGAVVATLGEVLPSVAIVIIVCRYLQKFRSSKLVNHAFYGLRPAVTGLIAAAGISVMSVSMFHLELYQQTGVLMDIIDI